jgi:hypothetical protein
MTARVLCFVPYGSWLVHNQVDAMLGLALKIRGAEVVFLTCDNVFQSNCYVLAHSKNRDLDCRTCSATGEQFLGSFGLPIHRLSECISDTDALEAEQWLGSQGAKDLSKVTWNGRELAEWVRPSVRSFYVVNPTELNSPEVQSLFRQYLTYGFIMGRAAERFFDRYLPTHLITFGGYGYFQGVVCGIARERGVNILTHERGSRSSSFTMASNAPVDSWPPMNQLLDAWDPVPFSQDEFESVQRLVQDWEVGRNRNAGQFYEVTSEATTLRSRLAIPDHARLLSVFTSGEHELSTLDERQFGGRQLEVIDQLIELFSDRDEFLVIRHHPGIGVRTKERIDYCYLTKALQQCRSLPPNVRIVMPNELLTSYSLLWNSDASIAFLSTIALEAMCRGVPTATLPYSGFSRSTSYRLTDLSRHGLRMMVDRLFQATESFSEADVQRAYLQLRGMFLKYAQTFRSFGIKNTHEHDIRITNLEELYPGRDETLDRVCDWVFTGASLFLLPTTEEKQRTPETTKKLFQDEWARIRQSRAVIRETATREEHECKEVGVFIPKLDDAILSFHWLTTQRHSRVSIREIWWKRDSTCSERLATLSKALTHINAPYVHIPSPFVWYENDFLRRSVVALELNNAVRGTLSAGWLEKESDRLSGHFLTSLSPVRSREEAIQRSSVLGDPLVFLSLAVFRRESLRELLANLPPGEERLIRELYSTLLSDEFLKIAAPGLVVQESAFS